MTDRPPLPEQLSERPTSIGTFFNSKSPPLAESLGHSALDFLLLDRQHTSLGVETVEAIVRAADLNGLPVVVRLATAGFDFVNTVLDAGAAGVIIPQAEDPGTVREVVEATRYGGTRSLALGSRANDFGSGDREEYVEWVNERLGVVAQVETEPAVGRAGELAGIDGVTALMLGPTDLSMSMGVPRHGDELRAAVDRVREAARGEGCGVGIFAGSAEELAIYRGEMDFVVYRSDAGILGSAFDGL
jgi:2-keto-3-deoxy-L-rhamnonate aldolase RhmA